MTTEIRLTHPVTQLLKRTVCYGPTSSAQIQVPALDFKPPWSCDCREEKYNNKIVTEIVLN